MRCSIRTARPSITINALPMTIAPAISRIEIAIVQREALKRTYTIDQDCTGTMTLEGQPGGTAHWDVFLTDDGKKGRMIRTDFDVAGVRIFEQ